MSAIDAVSALAEAGRRLTLLAERLRQIKEASPAQPRAQAVFSLMEVVNFLESFDSFGEEHLTDPLRSLLLAIGDLEKGTVDPILRPAKISQRPPMSSGEQTLMAAAAIAVDMLVKFRDVGSPTKAAQTVAKTLKEAGWSPPLRSNAKPLFKTVLGWRDRLSQGEGGDAPPFAAEQWAIYRAALKAKPETVDVEGWLRDLSERAGAAAL